MNKSVKLILSSLILGLSLNSINADEPTTTATTIIPAIIETPVDTNAQTVNGFWGIAGTASSYTINTIAPKVSGGLKTAYNYSKDTIVPKCVSVTKEKIVPACTGFFAASTPVVKNAIARTFNFIKAHPKEIAMTTGIIVSSYLSVKFISWVAKKMFTKNSTKKPIAPASTLAIISQEKEEGQGFGVYLDGITE